MSISIKKNDEIKLNIPKFLCDNDAVGQHLNDHPLTELLNVYGFTCLIGRPGSGKSSMAIALMTQKRTKDLSQNASSRNSYDASKFDRISQE